MKGLDTNVLVRYVVQDDPHQTLVAARIIEACDSHDPGYISLVVLVELVWVLTASYGLDRKDVAGVLDHILQVRELVIERADDAARAVKVFSQGTADFADCLIASLAKSAGCDDVLTFDRKAARTAGMTLLA